jgi:hypothetical protein
VEVQTPLDLGRRHVGPPTYLQVAEETVLQYTSRMEDATDCHGRVQASNCAGYGVPIQDVGSDDGTSNPLSLERFDGINSRGTTGATPGEERKVLCSFSCHPHGYYSPDPTKTSDQYVLRIVFEDARRWPGYDLR